jgi:hypothetical protein
MTTTTTSTMGSSSSRRKPLRNAPGTVIPGPRLSLSSPLYYKNKQQNRQPQLDNNETEEPFFLLVLKVGLTLAALTTVTFCLFSYHTLLLPSVSVSSSSYSQMPQQPEPRQPRKNKRPTKSKSAHGNLPFPTFTLGPDAEHDAFAVAAKYNLTITNDGSSSNNMQAFVQHAADMRKDFVYRYGASEIPARSILERGLSHMHSVTGQALALRNKIGKRKRKLQRTTETAPNEKPEFKLSSHDYDSSTGAGSGYRGTTRSLRQERQRSSKSVKKLQQKKEETNQFVILVVGSSAAAGYGNAHQQSYPYQLRDMLRHAFELQGLELVVRSVAMEDTTEFPLAWCLPHYTTTTPDLVIWDFGGDVPPARFEAFLRVTANLWNSNNDNNSDDTEDERFPFFMFREGSVGNEPRSRLIQYYMDANVTVDPVIIRHSQGAQPFLTMHAMDRPDGLQAWKDFGVTGPAQSRSLLSLQEHEMIAWMISMHLLAALELVAADESMGGNQVLLSASTKKPAVSLPPPLSKDFQVFQGRPWESLVRGEYDPNTLHCYTTFDYTIRNAEMESVADIDNDSTTTAIAPNLDELIVGGTIGQDFELLLPKTAMWYTQGWVLDLDATTTRSKLLIKHQSSNFLGFPDWKKAYYGVPQSNALSLFVPVGTDASLEHAQAAYVVDLLVLCESDAVQESTDSCTLRKDVAVTVGGKLAAIDALDTEIVATFEKQTCIQVLVPPDAILTAHTDTKKASKMFGLPIEIQVTNPKVTWANGPCSVAHVIFQRTDTIL